MSTFAKIDFLRSKADVFYDVRMTSTGTDAVGTDAILRHIDAEADSVSIEVTLYLPWGVATGITVSSEYFGHYVANFFAKNDAHDVAGRLGTLEAEQARVFCICARRGVTSPGPSSSTTRSASGSPMSPRGPLQASRNSSGPPLVR